MLTLEIDDARLEQKILEKARTVGKSVQDLVKEIISEKIEKDENRETLHFDVPKLDYRKYVRIIDEPVDDTIDDTPVFQNGIETIEFAKQLRKDTWRRNS